MALLVPAVNVSNEEEFVRRAQVVRELGVPWVQIDVSDGIIGVPKNYADPRRSLQELQGVNREIHLMVRDVTGALAAWRHADPQRVLVHAEALPDPIEAWQFSDDRAVARGIALGPSTPLDRILPSLQKWDLVLFVAVPLGLSGQDFDPSTVGRVRRLRRARPGLPIGVDGGVNERNIADLAAAGASLLYVASAIFGAADPATAYQKLQALAEA